MKPEVFDLLFNTLDPDTHDLFVKYAPNRNRREPGENWANPIIIAPKGEPYLYRWHVVPRNEAANVYLHIQVQSDPERPLHDHPYDNQSVVLSGGYDEHYLPWPAEAFMVRGSVGGRFDNPAVRKLRKGDVVGRKAAEAHHLILPPDIPYTMTLFSTGPRYREWGFWYPDGWHHHERHLSYENGVSVHVPDRHSLPDRGVSVPSTGV